MHKAILQFASGAALALAASTASAHWVNTTLEVTGVLQEIPGPSPRCPSRMGGTITGFGDSPQLGRVAFVANDCITPSGAIYTFDRGRFIVMTISGDQVYAEYSGQFVPTGDGAKYVFSGGSFRITGGTGRYMFATGGGQLDGGEDMATGSGNIKLSGRIAYWSF